MQSLFRRLAAVAAITAAAVLPTTQASTLIDFEDPNIAGAWFDGDVFSQSGFDFMPAFDAATVDTVQGLTFPPSGSTGAFYTQTNDGELIITHSQGRAFSLDGFSAAYVPTTSSSTPNTVLAVFATYVDKPADFALFAFLPASGGAYPFGVYDDPATFASFTNLQQVEFFTCSFVGQSLCTVIENNGQFAIDNILLTAAVPEASTTAMLALGLAGLLALRSRRTVR